MDRVIQLRYNSMLKSMGLFCSFGHVASLERLLTRSIAVGMLCRFVRRAKGCFCSGFFLRDFVWAGYIDMACAELKGWF